MQEGQYVGWDIRSMWDGPDTATRWFIFYLISILVAAFVWCFKLWQGLGWRSTPVRRTMEIALDYFGRRDFASLSSSVQKVSPQALEAGLRMWSTVSTESGSSAFLRVLNTADINFRLRWSQLSTAAKALKRTAWFTLLIAAFLATYEFIKNVEFLYESFQAQRVSRLSFGLMWAMREILGPFAMGFGASILCSLVYIYFYTRLERRKACWEYFCARIKEQ